jgi:hypothetical protein
MLAMIRRMPEIPAVAAVSPAPAEVGTP